MRRYGLRIFVAMAVMAAVGGTALAEDGPVVIGRRERGPFLTLDPFHGSVGLEGFFQAENSTTSGPQQQSTTTFLQETLSLNTSGSVVSKNFFNWHAAATLGTNQEWDTGGSGSSANYGWVYAYDLSADILPNSDVPTSIYARRGESYINRAFAALLKNTTTSYGATAAWQNTPVPMRITASHNNTVQAELNGSPDYMLDEDRLEYEAEWEPTERQKLTLNYQFNGVNQNNPAILNNQYNLNNLTATHDWAFDPDSRYTLSSYFNYSNQSGDFPYSQLRWNESLRMRHSDNFETNLNYTLDQQSYNSNVTTSNQVNGGFTHRLWDSLVTNGQAGGSISNTTYESAGGGSTTDNNSWFSNLGWNYNKKVPFGQLALNLGGGYTQTTNGAIGTEQEVRNQPKTFTDPAPIILTQPGVDANTIMVFNAAGTRQYVEGMDYTVRTVGNTVQIDRVVGGNIGAGETVLLDYDILPLPGYESKTTNLNTGLRYDFTEGALNGLGVFVQYFQQNQEINSDRPDVLIPDDIQDTQFGLEYRIGKLTLRAEQEYHDSTLAPFDATRFSARYADRLSDRTILSLTATQTFLNYPTENDKSNLTTIDGRLQYEITRDLRSIIAARWHYNDDTVQGVTNGWEDQIELRWKVRQTDIFLMFRHTMLDTSGGDTNSLFLQFGITRNF